MRQIQVTVLFASMAIHVLSCAVAAQEKLEYRHKQAVDRQQGNLAALQKRLEPLKDLEALAAQGGRTRQLAAEIQECETKCEAILRDLAKSGCPEAHPQVKALVDGVGEARKVLAAAKPVVEAGAAAAAKAVDPASYPELQKDVERLEAVKEAYTLSVRPDKSEAIAELMKDDARTREFVNGLGKKYAPLIASENNAGRELKSAIFGAGRAIKDFTAQAQKFVDTAKEEIRKNVAHAEECLKTAETEKKPAFVEGGAAQAVEQAEQRLKLFAALAGADHPTVKDLAPPVAAARERMGTLRESLRVEITAAARAPKDAYAGGDKAALEKVIREAWAAKHPKDRILGIRFHMQEWDRTQKLKWSEGDSSWNKIDHSVLCVSVIVQTSDTIATIYPAYLNRDHLSNDKTVPGVDTKGSAYVHTEMLIANL